MRKDMRSFIVEHALSDLIEKNTPIDVKWDMTTKEIRNFLKTSGIKARVQRDVITGQRTIAVSVAKFDDEFTAEQIAKFAGFAKGLGLTQMRFGNNYPPIDVEKESKVIGKGQTWRWTFHP